MLTCEENPWLLPHPPQSEFPYSGIYRRKDSLVKYLTIMGHKVPSFANLRQITQVVLLQDLHVFGFAANLSPVCYDMFEIDVDCRRRWTRGFSGNCKINCCLRDRPAY